MLNRVQYGHDPQTDRFALAIGSQSIGVWELAPVEDLSMQVSASARTKRPRRTPALTISTPTPGMTGLVFLAPTVLLSVHESGDFVAWRIADAHGHLLERVELLWEFRLPLKPCMTEVHGGYGREDFRIAVGTKSGTLLMLLPRAEAQPEVACASGAHQSEITALAFSPGGTALASAGRDRLIKLWDAREFEAPQDGTSRRLRVTQELSGSEAWPLCLGFSHAGDRLASGGMDHDLNLWKVGAGVEHPLLGSVIEHYGWIVDLAWSPDDSAIATASWDNSVGIFEPAGLSRRASLSAHRDYVSTVHFAAGSDALISGGYDGYINRWNWREGTVEASAKAHSDWLLNIHAPEATRIISVSSDYSAAVWGSADLRRLERLEGNPIGGYFAEEALGLNGYSEAGLSSEFSGGFSEVTDGSSFPDAFDAFGAQEPADAFGEELEEESVAEEIFAEPSAAAGATPEEPEPVFEDALRQESEAQEDVQEDAQDIRVDLSQALAEAEEEGGEAHAALAEFFDDIPADLGLGMVSSSASLAVEAPEPAQDDDGAPAVSFETVKMQSVAIDEVAARDREHATKTTPSRNRAANSLSSRLKARLSAELPAVQAPASPAESKKKVAETTPIYLGSIGSQAEAEITPETQVLPAIGFDLQSDVFEEFGEALNQAAPEVVQTSEPAQVVGEDAPKPAGNAFGDRSGTATRAIPIGPRDSAPVMPETQAMPAVARAPEFADSPAQQRVGLDEETAPRRVGLSEEFETPTRMVLLPETDEQEPKMQLGSAFAKLRAGKLFGPDAHRLSAGQGGGSGLLEIPDLRDAGMAPESEGVELIDTDFKDIWERRWTPSAPGMAIIARSVAPTQHYELACEFESPHRQLTSLALDTKRKLIASCGADGRVVIWKFDGEEKHRFEVADAKLNVVVFAAGATLIYAGDDAGVLHGWVLPQKTLGSAGVLRHARRHAHSSGLTSLAFSPDEKALLSGSVDGQVRVWGVDNAPLLRSLDAHDSAVSAVLFAEQSVLSAGHDGFVKRWNRAGAQIDLAQADAKILAMAARCGNLIWGSEGGRVWTREEKGEATLELMAHQGAVRAVAVSTMGEPVSAGTDGCVHIYARAYTRPFQTIESGAPIATVKRAGNYIIIGNADGQIAVYKRG